MPAWLTYHGVDLFRPGGSAYTYSTNNMAIDADGAPNAYGPDNSGLDDLQNAGFPNGGWRNVLAVDPNDHNKPFIQPNGPTKGFFVAMTTLTDPTLPAIDPKKYVDASTIPYIVYPGAFNALHGTGTMGDFVMAKNQHNGKVSAAIVADVGETNAPLGEVSIALVTALGGAQHPDPRTGAGMPSGPFRYVVFPFSGAAPRWPLTAAEIDMRANALLNAAGGWAAFDNPS